jgi:two-component system, OmpR family, sensor kinase
MARRAPRTRLGLRPRLAGGVAVILLVTLGATFGAIYRGVGRDLQAQVDRDLRGDMSSFEAHVLPARSGAEVVERARRFLAARPFTASAHVLFARVPGQPVVTNEPELLSARGPDPGETAESQAEENAAARAVLNAPPGVRTVDLPDAGDIRLLVRVVRRHGRPLARLAAGESLEPLHRAQRGVARAALVAIPIALVVSTLASALLASRLTRRLRIMAGVAARVDAGELSPRMGAVDTADEVRVLAEAFDHMLDRLEDAFARQAAFVADASHELRTPLTVVRGQLEVLAMQEHPDRDEVRRVERLVRIEVERMSRMVDDLLVLAAAGEPRFLRLGEVELRPFLAELVHGIEATADRRFELGEVSARTLHADPDRLAQALRNLLRNAIAHTQPGGRIRVSATAAAGGRVRLAIDDDGPGIPPEERERIWGRFHRTSDGRSRDAGGAGLGLAIVRAIAEAHGGSAFAEASPLGGARVGIELPA